MEQHLKTIAQLQEGLAGLGNVLSRLESQTLRTSRTVHWAAKGAVADFDRLDRLNFGGGGSSTVTLTTKLSGELMNLATLVGKIKFDTLHQGLAKLSGALTSLGHGSFLGLHWGWSEVLEPMSHWQSDQPLTEFLQGLGGKLAALFTTTQTARPTLSWLWEGLLKPLGTWTGQTLQVGLEGLRTKLASLSPTTGALESLRTGLDGVSQAADGLKEKQAPLSGLFSGLTTLAQTLAGTVATLSGKMAGLYPAFHSVGSAAVAAANTVLAGIESAFNAMSGSLRALSFQIPSWVPVLGGKKFFLDLGSVSFPRVPQLARGAVLPANKPFLAMVGDQKHGTNIEAPLETIQQALSNVLMGSQPGQQEANALLSRILTAIEQIQVGDETIGRAARRYEQKMAVLGGGL